jgi:drug/metabolite transporter (DMT)-like permease
MIFNVFWEEECHIKETIGALLMPIGWAVILYKWEDFINLWWAIMILACLMMTVWNLYTKRANKHWTNPMFLITNRNFIVFIISIIFAYIYVGPIALTQISENLIWIIAIWVLILFTAKVLFAMTLARVKWFIAISFFPAIPLFVLLFSYIFLWEIPSLQQILWFIPIFIGSYLLVKKH